MKKRPYIFDTPVYDLAELVRYNLHVHTFCSRCGKADMHMPLILAEADRAGLEMIAITDHSHYAELSEVAVAQARMHKRIADKIPHRVKVLYGAELSNPDIGVFYDTDEANDALEYRLYATNHFQIDGFVHPEDKSIRGYAEYLLKKTRVLMESGRADCVAHPLTGMRVPVCTPPEVSAAMTDNEIGELCELSARTHVALEINRASTNSDPELVRRLWNLGREAGAFLHYGADAHDIGAVDTIAQLADLKAILN